MFRWKTFLTKHVNKEWSSTFDEDGYGPMYEDDYKRLMESHGFRVFFGKTVSNILQINKGNLMYLIKHTDDIFSFAGFSCKSHSKIDS